MKRRLDVLGAGSLRSEDEGSASSELGSVARALPAGAEPPPLRDALGRAYNYLRLSVTDRCDFACVYCMPPSGEEDHAERPELLTFEEIARLCRVVAGMGVNRIRFTGGEPLVRRDVVRLIELVARSAPRAKLVMTSNGSRLSELARPLRAAGLSGVNISVDTLDPERFELITRGGKLKRVLAGVHAALEAGLAIKLNAVLLDRTLEDAPALVDWAWSLGITPRFIELMPLGEASKLPADSFVSQVQLTRALGSRLASSEPHGFRPEEGAGPARYLMASDGSGRRVGIISAVSNEFCGSCNRLRVTARGDVRACLASRRALSLRDLMRSGADDRLLGWAVHEALGTKLPGHLFNDPAADEHRHVGMSLIGG